MILGIGNDIISVARLQKVFDRPTGEAFKDRVFTKAEQDYCDTMANSTPSYGARWALKEAFYKALPEDIQSIGTWKGIELVRVENSKPMVMILDPKLQEAFDSLGTVVVHHSISHEKEFCIANVTLELR